MKVPAAAPLEWWTMGKRRYGNQSRCRIYVVFHSGRNKGFRFDLNVNMAHNVSKGERTGSGRKCELYVL